MKIALVILHADPARGGAERYTLDLAAALAARGHEVSLLAVTFAQLPSGVQRVDLPARGLTRVARYRRMLDSLDRRLDAARYDIVHAMLPVRRCHIYHPHAGLAVASLRLSLPAALFNPRRRAMAYVERQLLQSSHPPVVLCLSNYLKQTVRQRYPLDERHLPVLFNGVDLTRFDPDVYPLTGNDDKIVALFIGQDFARKGLRQAIVALSRISDPRLILRVVGRQDTHPYQRLAQRLNVSGRVQFAGASSDVAQEYRNADFLLLPTKHDPCSLVVLEALAMGLPVISTRFNGACELMTDGLHGYVLSDPDDVAVLALAMQKMLDPQIRARMSAACLELRPMLSHEKHLDRLISIYQQVLGR